MKRRDAGSAGSGGIPAAPSSSKNTGRQECRLSRRLPQRAVLVFGTFLLAVVLYVDRICISAAKDDITRDLALTDKQFGWVLSAFALGYALFQTPSGWLADRFGPRRILTSVVALWSVFTGLTGWMTGYVSMLAVRFLFGAGEAGGYPCMARAVYSWVPMKEASIFPAAASAARWRWCSCRG